MAGRDKVHIFVDVLHGGFGLLLMDQFSGVKLTKQFDEIRKTLQDFTFPVVSFVFSASGRLREKDHNDLVVSTQLEELELRIAVTHEPGDTPVKTIGLLPSETTTSKPRNNTVKFAPSISSVLGPVTLGLGVAVSAFLRPKPEVLAKPFMGGPNEFGWYMKSGPGRSCEGVHHTAAVLQVNRNVENLKIKGELATDWKGGDVDNQTQIVNTTFVVSHPQPPTAPVLIDITDADTWPVLLRKEVVSSMLGEDTVNGMLENNSLVTYKRNGTILVTRASLLKVLGETIQ